MKDKEFCSNHDCVINEIKHLDEGHKEMKKTIEQIRDDIRNLSTHEKVYIAFIGFCGVALSAGGSVLGTLLAQGWFK